MDPEKHRKLAKEGGKALAKRDPEHMREIGRKGGLAARARQRELEEKLRQDMQQQGTVQEIEASNLDVGQIETLLELALRLVRESKKNPPKPPTS